jgi:hypothetical protein
VEKIFRLGNIFPTSRKKASDSLNDNLNKLLWSKCFSPDYIFPIKEYDEKYTRQQPYNKKAAAYISRLLAIT